MAKRRRSKRLGLWVPGRKRPKKKKSSKESTVDQKIPQQIPHWSINDRDHSALRADGVRLRLGVGSDGYPGWLLEPPTLHFAGHAGQVRPAQSTVFPATLTRTEALQAADEFWPLPAYVTMPNWTWMKHLLGEGENAA